MFILTENIRGVNGDTEKVIETSTDRTSAVAKLNEIFNQLVELAIMWDGVINEYVTFIIDGLCFEYRIEEVGA